MQVSLTNYGASLQDLRLLSHDIPLVLGFPDAQDYAAQTSHMGATAGRYANRIAAGQITIDGHSYQLDQNEAGHHCLHGGSQGCGTRLWQLAAYDERSVTFTLDEADGHMGFPGAVHLRCQYQMIAPQTLAITYHATTSAPTFVNLAHHSYFKLDDRDDNSRHELQIMADHYLPVTASNLPDGRQEPVAKTAFDFREMRPIGKQDYDHNFCLANRDIMRPIARLYSPYSGIEMQMDSDQAGLQFYTAHHLDEAARTHHGRAYRKSDGICLEPQNWPNSPNMAQFPSSLLRPSETYHQRLILRFTDRGQG